ncbi:MBL fold metallo-hydrolase [Mobilitalea sibirica]|uniref:MBL fold metallo-hydrolase n=1 Tax=Mobilitalea sibirica TaxID=1462919 RepID=A0A8J7KVW7_9FIRM|nr:MBL fold metallo-hydrolase [Mobilitalea sibirica]MBH1939642.1 MBL fold metallo-hydrolase [Mobilitalea sibirica]
MKVITLLENSTISKAYKNKHGLSLYIETSKHKILFDTGPDTTFLHNANKLGVNLEDIDIAIISHGHFDHGGGLEAFLNLNHKANVYLGKDSFDHHLIKLFGFIKYNIGLKKELINNERLVFVDGILKIDDELTLFGNITGEKLIPPGNKNLLKEYGKGLIKKDDFQHEINLLVNENDKYTLFCGCAHKGIINIIEQSKEIIKSDLDTVIGGFHLMGLTDKKTSSINFLDELADDLNKRNINKYYTCHCTGEKPSKYLGTKMQNLFEVKTGTSLEL